MMSANAGNDQDRESRKVPAEIENDIVFEKFCDFSRSHGPIVHGAFGSGTVESAEGQETYDLPFQHAAAALGFPAAQHPALPTKYNPVSRFLLFV